MQVFKPIDSEPDDRRIGLTVGRKTNERDWIIYEFQWEIDHAIGLRYNVYEWQGRIKGVASPWKCLSVSTKS